MDILNTPARLVNGEPGTTDTAVMVRFRDGTTVPVGVQVGHCASEYLDAYNTNSAVVVGVRQDGVFVDLLKEPADLLREAYRRLREDAVFRYRAELTARVVKRLRTDDPHLMNRTYMGDDLMDRTYMDDDRMVAAIALVVNILQLPGATQG